MVYKVAPGEDTETVHLSLDYDFKKEGVHAFKRFLDQYTSSPEDVVTLYVVEDISRPGDAYDRGDDEEIPLDLDALSALHIPKYIQKSMRRDNLTNTQQISAYLRKIHGGAQQQKSQKSQKTSLKFSSKEKMELAKPSYREISGYVTPIYRHFTKENPNKSQQWYADAMVSLSTTISIRAIKYFENLGYKEVGRHKEAIKRDIIKALGQLNSIFKSKQTQKPKQQQTVLSLKPPTEMIRGG